MAKAFAAGRRNHQIRVATVLMLHMEDTGLTDSSYSSNDPTLTNQTARSANPAFGTYGAVFDGAGDGMTLSDRADLNSFDTGDLTIIGSFKAASGLHTAGNDVFYFGKWAAAADRWWLQGVDRGSGTHEYVFTVRTGNVERVSLLTSVDPGGDEGGYVRLAITRSGTTFTMYREGASIGTDTASDDMDNSGIFYIADGPAYLDFKDYIDEFQIIKGLDISINGVMPTPATAFAI